MTDVQEILEELRVKGWSRAAIADEVGAHRETVSRWGSGRYYPENAKAVLVVLNMLLKRKAPPGRRYPHGHYLQRDRVERERRGESG